MCGIAGTFGPGWTRAQLDALVAAQTHRGPDGHGVHVDAAGRAGLGHNRLSIIDLSPAGSQPMASADGRLRIAFNGEIYNYVELRAELAGYPFRSNTDTEVILAAYDRWGEAALDRLVGMFAFLLWDERERRLLAARDRFGVKPLHFHHAADGTLVVASEIQALRAVVATEPDPVTWATYFSRGLHDHSARTFWTGIRALPPGHRLTWQDGRLDVACWYDLADRIGPEPTVRPAADVEAEYLALLQDSIRLRFRADVPVGVNLSGGLDSSTLLGLVQAVHGADCDVKAFTYVTGDPCYDELPWVRQMLAHTRHPSVACLLEPADVPALAASVQAHEQEPFGGIPTLAYARLCERARAEGVLVLLDGQGMDEQWAGYDYYAAALAGTATNIIQGTRERTIRPTHLTPEFRDLAEDFVPPTPFGDAVRDLQYRDARHTKLPRALRFNDIVSMRASVELREPFLDHRLFELALRQPVERKIVDGKGKWMLRRVAERLLPHGLAQAPKRPVQTPQREWLRGPLYDWADACIERALDAVGGTWLDADAVRASWATYADGAGDNSFYVWQWVSLGLLHDARAPELQTQGSE